VVILLAQERPVRLLGAYLAGGLTISISIGLVIVFALDGSGSVSNEKALLSVGADLAIGGLSLLAAVALALRADERLRERRRRRRPQPPPDPEVVERDPWSQRILARGSTPIVFIAAMAINLPGAAYLIALKDIAAGNHSTATAVALVVLFNAIMFLLAEIPLAGLLVAPERTNELVARMDAWISGHSRQLAVGLCVVLGVYLVSRGIANA
jgi:hypothetical protein